MGEFEHQLGNDFPKMIDAAPASLDEVRLLGTFNVKRHTDEAKNLLTEVKRVLKPGGAVKIRLVVADKLVTKALPKLSGASILIEHTPTEIEIMGFLERNGFQWATIQTLSASAAFQFEGAQMREMMVTAKKRMTNISHTRQSVIYKGPYKSVCDDEGNYFPRGYRVEVSGETFSSLSQSAIAGQFVFLGEKNWGG